MPYSAGLFLVIIMVVGYLKQIVRGDIGYARNM